MITESTGLIASVSLPDPAAGEGQRIADRSLQTWFWLISIIFFIAYRAARFQRTRAAAPKLLLEEDPWVPKEEIAGRVTGLAQDLLGIGEGQREQSFESLGIPRGDFLNFLSDLETDHGLRVPESAARMSSSVADIIAALCARAQDIKSDLRF